MYFNIIEKNHGIYSPLTKEWIKFPISFHTWRSFSTIHSVIFKTFQLQSFPRMIKQVLQESIYTYEVSHNSHCDL